MSTAAKKRRSRSQTDEVLIPDKIYFRIGEVSKLSKLPAYVLRFWETEFPQLKPTKGSTGQRMYRRRDVENVLLIKKLLYEEGYTISGAREKLKAETRPSKGQPVLPFPKKRSSADLNRIRQGLQEILMMLNKKR